MSHVKFLPQVGQTSGKGFPRRGLLLLLGMLSLGMLDADLWAQGAAAGKPRNVVLIVADDLGLDLGCYGDKVAKTPHLDALAREGTRFTHAFCTTASCSASRSVILTGLHNHANGQYGHQHGSGNFHTRTSVRSLPVLMKEAGYRTYSIGKFHVQPEEVYKFDKFGNEGGKSRSPVQMAEATEKFLQEKDDKPFFVYFCMTEPHRAGKGFGNEGKHQGVTPVVYLPAEVKVPEYLPDHPEVRAEWAEYLQAVSRLDQGVGRLVKALQETGKYEQTLILFISDNGPPFPGAKTTLYDPGMRLPLIVRSPDQKLRGITTNALVNWTDLAPTILDFAGAKGPSYPLHGRSFLPVLEQATPKGWDEVFASHTFHEITMYYPMRAIRTRDYKLIYNIAHPLPFPFASDLYASKTWQQSLARKDTLYGQRTVQAYVQRPQFELYDLTADPYEIKNLAESKAHAGILKELQKKLRDFQERTKDPWVSKYEYE